MQINYSVGRSVSDQRPSPAVAGSYDERDHLKTWGALPDEWVHFDLVLGYTDRLLPVVCNAEATISPSSKMKALGKTPSIYNSQRQVIGITEWTSKSSSGADIEKWMMEPDYGICVKTGSGIVALDCDSDDVDVQARIQAFMLQSFGQIPPRRFRNNSNKCLYLIAVEGEFSKRVHRLKNDLGIVELLAKGQQFVAMGTHPSGARLQWDNDLPSEPFMITEKQLNDFWKDLADELPVVSSSESDRVGKVRDRSIVTPNATDEVAEFLDSQGLTLDYGRNGERYITCPFESGHSTDSGVTSTAYFPKNTAGFEVGHFKCLHASCAHRNDGDFLHAIGFGKDDFDDLSSNKTEEGFTDINMDMTSHFLERFIYVVKGDQVCDLSRPPYNCVIEMKSFKNLMAPFQIPSISKKGQPTSATKRWIEHPKKQVAESIGYQPGKGRLIKRHDGRFDINEFYLPDHAKVSNFDKSDNIFLKHMEYLLPKKEQRDFFIARLAWIVQRPDRRCPITILHISLLHGTGRGWVIQLMEKILGSWNCTRAKMDVICKNQYHDYLHHSLLCTVDEVRENTDKRYSISDQLRDILTEPRFEVNNKYGKKITEDIFTSFLFLSNHIDAIIIPEEDRRIAVFGGPDHLQDVKYYETLYRHLQDANFISQVFWYLKSIDLNQLNWQRAPDTEERQIMIESSRSDVAKTLHDLIDAPISPVMTYQQIVNFIIGDMGSAAEINAKQIAAILRSKGLTQYGRLKFKGDAVRPWILVKKRKLTNEEVRIALEKCEELQEKVTGDT
ncbi:DUF5906 domain-containing protein [Arsenophonus nasoniae]|uniref:DUF5906 domain-containing protein n=1 Tax=Arsenophonus nasoniae TaxID=638 RepID=A0AA95GK75_9GAMM|nr:DUF5906 domain-containing protein [Arsenophonus nasoniae]WGM00043.1 DUF5906 domain-containing protein [Arsenophonus nasoniae]